MPDDTATLSYKPIQIAHESAEAAAVAPAESSTVLGFWIYLMSDCVIFAVLFACFSVLGREYAGGPTGHQLFNLGYVGVETTCLLLSSFTCGMAMLALHSGSRAGVRLWLGVTFLLGALFVGMEMREFSHMLGDQAGPGRSAFLSSFFTLVGTHGLHVTAGLIWIAVMMAQVTVKGLNAPTHTRLMCFSLFWHFLDIVWVGVFSVVYLIGST